jgi:ankyrin repeat protein
MKKEADFEHVDIYQWNSLHYACRHGDFEMVKILVEKAKININSTNSSGFTALHIAAKNGFMEICKYLIEDAPVD